ncbi:MAG TPA: hypothetical protein VHU23_19180 [Rhizomicrobium sp.]|jgi:hypothetical protein|nr:hypothetical protein [Rhizomicrobium sp.]
MRKAALVSFIIGLIPLIVWLVRPDYTQYTIVDQPVLFDGRTVSFNMQAHSSYDYSILLSFSRNEYPQIPCLITGIEAKRRNCGQLTPVSLQWTVSQNRKVLFTGVSQSFDSGYAIGYGKVLKEIGVFRAKNKEKYTLNIKFPLVLSLNTLLPRLVVSVSPFSVVDDDSVTGTLIIWALGGAILGILLLVVSSRRSRMRPS